MSSRITQCCFFALFAAWWAGCAATGTSAEANSFSPAAGVLFEDNFKSTRRWQESVEPPCEVSYFAQGLRVKNINTAGTCEVNLTAAGDFPPRVRIEAAVTKLGGSEEKDFGIKFGFWDQPGAPYYTFTVKGDGTCALGLYEGVWKMLVPWQMAPRAGLLKNDKTTRLAVEIRNRELKVFANGRFVGAARAAQAVRGHVGLYLDAPGLDVEFTDLRVVAIE